MADPLNPPKADLKADQLVDFIAANVEKGLAEKVDEAIRKAREANHSAGIVVATQKHVVNGVDAGIQADVRMKSAAGAVIRAAAAAVNTDGDTQRLVSDQFLNALKNVSSDPRALELYKKGVEIQKRRLGGAGYKALGETTFIDGGAVVPPVFVEEIIEFLRPKVVVRALGARVVPMPRGNMTFPFALTGSVASNTVENTATPTTQPSFGNFQLIAKKVRAIIPISNDLLQDASPMADAFVQQDLANELQRLEDFNFLRGSGNGGQMKGLRNQAATTLLATNSGGLAGTSTVTDIIMDLVRFPLALENNNITIRNGGFAWAPRTKWALMQLRDGIGNFYFKAEMIQGTLFGYKFGTTTTEPINLDTTAGVLSGKESEILFADFDRIIIGDTQELTIMPFMGGSYFDTATGLQISGISNDQTVIVGQMRSDIGARYRGAEIVNMTQVTWGA